MDDGARELSKPGQRSVASTLRELDIRPTRGKGQNFLTSSQVVGRIADLVQAGPNDVVVEVGPGLGILTEALADRAGQVVAIELDERLADHLEATLQRSNVTILTADALTIDPALFVPSDREYAFAANLPYSVGSAIVRRFLELESAPTRLVVMLQREVAERMAASPPQMSILSVAVQVYASARVAFNVPPTAFKPRPKVESSVLVLEPYQEALLSPEGRESFFSIVHAGFHQKRKQIANTLSTGLGIPKAEVVSWLTSEGIEPDRRAETLSVEDWLTLHRTRPA